MIFCIKAPALAKSWHSEGPLLTEHSASWSRTGSGKSCFDGGTEHLGLLMASEADCSHLARIDPEEGLVLAYSSLTLRV